MVNMAGIKERRGAGSKVDYIKRFIIAIIMVLCVSLLFLGGKNTRAHHAEAIDTPMELSQFIS